VYRMDDVPITLRVAFDSAYPSDETVLSAIKDRLAELLAEKRGYGALKKAS
jgi:formylmethanofuran dehydrogenase subunit B